MAWAGAGLTAPQACLVNDLAQGLGLKTYVRTRGWTDDELDEAVDGLRADQVLVGDDLSGRGHQLRADLEQATDRQQRSGLDALAEDELDELLDLLRPMVTAIQRRGCYPTRAYVAKVNSWEPPAPRVEEAVLA